VLPASGRTGPDQIQATFAGFFQAAGPINSVTVTSTTTQGGAILTTYKVESDHIAVSDGVDTFVIQRGSHRAADGISRGTDDTSRFVWSWRLSADRPKPNKLAFVSSRTSSSERNGRTDLLCLKARGA